MPEVQKEVEDMKEFMTILMDVKVSLAQQNEKLDNLLDIKQKVDATYDTANFADKRSQENEKDIERLNLRLEKECTDLKLKIDKKASNEDVDRIVKEKDNWKKNAPGWAAVVVSVLIGLFTVFTSI